MKEDSLDVSELLGIDEPFVRNSRRPPLPIANNNDYNADAFRSQLARKNDGGLPERRSRAIQEKNFRSQLQKAQNDGVRNDLDISAQD